MTQIQGRPSVNMFEESSVTRELRDNRTYRAGKDGSLKKASKAGTFFKETFSAETVKKQNQKTLDSLMRQLTQEYGSDSFNASRESLRVPEEVLSGKRAITGRDLKALAASVRVVGEAKAQAISGPLTVALKGVMSKGNPNPADVLQALSMNMPRSGSPQVQQMAFQQAVSKLSPAQCRNLQNLMFSKTVIQAKQFLDEAVGPMTAIGKGLNEEVARRRNQTAGVLIPVQDSIAMTRQALLVWGRAQGYPAPQPALTRPITWKQPDADAMKLLDGIKLGRTDLAKMALRNIMPQETQQGFLRSSDFGILLFRAIGSEKLYAPLKEVENIAKEAILKDLDNLKTLLNVTTLSTLPSAVNARIKERANPDPAFTARMMKTVMDAIDTHPTFKTRLAECVSFMQEHIAPIVREKFGDLTPELLRSGFNGLFSIGVTGTLSTEIGNSEDGENKTALMIANNIFQAGLSETFIKPDKPFGKYMESVPGWKEMTTMPPKP